MKKVFIFLFTLSFPFVVFGQNFEFEVFRTEETPGFFGIRIFPGKTLAAMDIKDVFVQNYPEDEKDIYGSLIPTLRNYRLQVIDTDQLEEFSNNKRLRITILGEEIEGFLNLKLSSKESASADFQKYLLENLGPTFFQDVRFNFGGNISEVLPSQISYWGGEEIFLVGKFEKPMRTYAEIVGVTTEGEVMASAIFDLRSYLDVPIAHDLPDIWEERLRASEEKEDYDLFWLPLFSWILGGLGGIILVFVLISQVRQNRNEKPECLFDNENYKKLREEELPFEVKSR